MYFVIKHMIIVLTFVIVDKDVFVSGVVSVVIDIPDDDGECVGSGDRWITAVLHDDRHVVLLTVLTVECLQTRYYARAVCILSTTYSNIINI